MYVCAKCVGGGELAGLCLACSLHCHEGHQLYELYTKRWVNGGAVEEEEKQTWFTVLFSGRVRHFRCDCGNGKFPGFTCTLCPVSSRDWEGEDGGGFCILESVQWFLDNDEENNSVYLPMESNCLSL